MMRTQQPVRIIGAGIGGLTLGRCLLQYGVPAVLYEKLSSPPNQGHGITLHASSYRPLLDVLGLDEWTFRCRIAVDGPIGGTGNIDLKSIIYPRKMDSTSFLADHSKLKRLLREGLDVQWNYGVTNVQESSSGTELYFQTGQKVESPCIIGADGPHSEIRKSLSPDASFKILPYVVFNGRRVVKRTVFDNVYAPTMGKSNVVEMKRGDLILKVSVSEQRESDVHITWVYSRPPRGDADPLHRPNRAVSGARDIPTEFFEEIGALQAL
ncbi:hypothetical protein F4820DRAFT_439195 [Hypoxylon rubiginosum]|uniref:Uncharacterized protein n=1 Tax=Hypoxylon rubiginosum TaxID=110542 RepID=A0ACB9YJV5_9PEZI|nr:hypothetical protein F4820DRAFT_439195 [Hypoxylon rubiginosum]